MRFTTVMQDERGFVHKRLLGIGKAIVGTALGAVSSPIGGVAASVIPGGGFFQRGLRLLTSRFQPRPVPSPAAPAPPAPSRHRATVSLPFNIPNIPDIIDVFEGIIPGGNGPSIPGGGLGFNGGTCKPPNTMVGDICVRPGTPAGPPGEAVMGRFGAALEPTFQTINKRVCLPGMVLGKPDVGGLPLCYNIGAISNKERLWPKGAAPLLTGGEMSAIRKAATAAGKFQRAGKRLAAVGKTFSGPAARRAPRRVGPRGTGPTVKVLESGPGSVQL